MKPRSGETWREYITRLAEDANRIEEVLTTFNNYCRELPVEEAALKTINIWGLKE